MNVKVICGKGPSLLTVGFGNVPSTADRGLSSSLCLKGNLQQNVKGR